MQSKTLQIENIFSNNTLAGDESLNWHPFLSDVIKIGRKLEELGFTYHNGSVLVIDPSEMQQC